MRKLAGMTLLGGLLLTLSGALAAGEYKLEIKTDKPDAIYGVNEAVTFLISLTDGGAPAKDAKIKYSISRDGHANTVDTVDVPADGQPAAVKTSLEKPGWMWIAAAAVGADGKSLTTLNKEQKPVEVRANIGAMVDPLRIKEAAPEPADFDAFWKSQREILDAVPVKATETVAEPPEAERMFLAWEVKVDCAGPRPVSGFVTMPPRAKPGSLPAIVIFHGAGVRSANKPVWRNAIAFDVNAHGIDNAQPREYYSELSKGELNNYPNQGADSRDTFYFKNMYLRVMRALDYIKTRPEWDGKTLIVTGNSQGGGQSIVAAALDHQVTLCVAGVPALGDHNARLAGRLPGWPKLLDRKDLTPEQKEKIALTAGYYDNVNFAKRIRCETFMSTGFVDTTCVPTSVYAAYNSLPADVKKFIVTTPNAGHGAPITDGDRRIREIISGK